jgi:hypothetical protein
MAIYRVVALHPILVDKIGDGVTFTREQLQRHGGWLSNKRLNINHADLPKWQHLYGKSIHTRSLPFPDNKTLEFQYDAEEDGLVGRIQLADARARELIAIGKIQGVSVETVRVDNIIGFLGLALVTDEFVPRDSNTRIMEHQITIEELDPISRMKWESHMRARGLLTS